jgi:hypothetical protein
MNPTIWHLITLYVVELFMTDPKCFVLSLTWQFSAGLTLCRQQRGTDKIRRVLADSEVILSK